MRTQYKWAACTICEEGYEMDLKVFEEYLVFSNEYEIQRYSVQ